LRAARAEGRREGRRRRKRKGRDRWWRRGGMMGWVFVDVEA